ncbi:uracil-DNA glycosylase [Terrarubrum flagellatum]|uniref:uracil-DNA glycosylase n=1 Tax=Terrirubrum flagellatum TaxID=2895980 RepID=UPI0031453FDC
MNDLSSAYAGALESALADGDFDQGWRSLPFFSGGRAKLLLREVDARAARGVKILPAPQDIFRALYLTPLDRAGVVILGQDPYPTPGHAHGLAFSYVGDGTLPASLRNIFKELKSDLGIERGNGDLSDWAKQGVLLLNTALTVEAGAAGAHMKLGWQELTREAVRAVAKRGKPAIFILWGDKARSYRDLTDASRDLIIESAHPSPLSARNGFFGSKPFSRANEFLRAKNMRAIDW